ncbi:XkdX family protein [Caloramator sp. Dgby_cultured_2]|nr:XkdX family protein [Caloramator sp. Dgby_cultured_2]WDU84191.1 XkdX family protein [Caloramator sp. Dgby_cultured_2]
MSKLYNFFLQCWLNGTVDETRLQNAVAKGYITQEEYEQIIATSK